MTMKVTFEKLHQWSAWTTRIPWQSWCAWCYWCAGSPGVAGYAWVPCSYYHVVIGEGRGERDSVCERERERGERERVCVYE